MKNVSFENCTAKNARGFELRRNEGILLENCTTIGTERAYWIGDNAIVKNCKGDANYGPLLFVEGDNVKVEVEVLPAESDRKVHGLASIQGSNNQVALKPANGQNRSNPLPILIGYAHPEHGESMSPFGEAPAIDLKLRNETTMPVVTGEQVRDSEIITKEKMLEKTGEGNIIKKL